MVSLDDFAQRERERERAGYGMGGNGRGREKTRILYLMNADETWDG